MQHNRDIRLNDSDKTGILPMHCYRQATGDISSPQSEVYNMDCIEGMKHYPDKYFDLAVVDPPYGLDKKLANGSCKKNKIYSLNRWDKPIDESYLIELFRVSLNIIFWGGNYYANMLPASRGWIVWKKFEHNNIKFSHGELAWTSFDKKLEITDALPDGISGKSEVIHPTQKPISLYDYCFKYADVKEGMRILDTHLGSGASRISASKMKLNFVGFEKDKGFYKAQNKRYEDFIKQIRLF